MHAPARPAPIRRLRGATASKDPFGTFNALKGSFSATQTSREHPEEPRAGDV